MLQQTAKEVSKKFEKPLRFSNEQLYEFTMRFEQTATVGGRMTH